MNCGQLHTTTPQSQDWTDLQSVSLNRICTPGLRCQIVNGIHLSQWMAVRSTAVQIKIDINNPPDNCCQPVGSRDGVYLQTNSSINNWLLANRQAAGSSALRRRKMFRHLINKLLSMDLFVRSSRQWTQFDNNMQTL